MWVWLQPSSPSSTLMSTRRKDATNFQKRGHNRGIDDNNLKWNRLTLMRLKCETTSSVMLLGSSLENHGSRGMLHVESWERGARERLCRHSPSACKQQGDRERGIQSSSVTTAPRCFQWKPPRVTSALLQSVEPPVRINNPPPHKFLFDWVGLRESFWSGFFNSGGML